LGAAQQAGKLAALDLEAVWLNTMRKIVRARLVIAASLYYSHDFEISIWLRLWAAHFPPSSDAAAAAKQGPHSATC
jgi:hypothetical protein